jgi:glucose-6-phosphate 1-dehydrogenase
MQKETRPDASIFVIFGDVGDLTWRKLMPALYNLFLDHWPPKKFWVKVFEVSIQFRQVPQQTFPSTVLLDWLSNRLVIAIQSEVGDPPDSGFLGKQQAGGFSQLPGRILGPGSR